MFVRGLTGNKPLTAVPMDARHLLWSPDGSALVAAETRTGPGESRYPADWLITPGTGEKKALDLPPGYVHDWSPDGAGFLMSVADPDGKRKPRLAVVGWDGRKETTLQARSPCWPEVARFSPDGRAVLAGLFADEESDEWQKSLPRLYAIDVATKAKREVPGVPLNASVTEVCWSPDGEQIAYQWKPIPADLGKRKFSEVKPEELAVETGEEFVTRGRPRWRGRPGRRVGKRGRERGHHHRDRLAVIRGCSTCGIRLPSG